MAKPSTCRSCGARIIWAEHGGERIPLNATRVRLYELLGPPGNEPIARTMVEGARPLLGYVSHFVSCPNASQHSKRGRS